MERKVDLVHLNSYIISGQAQNVACVLNSRSRLVLEVLLGNCTGNTDDRLQAGHHE